MPDGVKAGTAYVDVDADLAKLKKTVDQGVPAAVDGAAQKAAQQAGGRFAGLGAHLKKGLIGSLSGLSGISIGGGVTAIGAGLDALAAPAERAKKQLEATFAATGQSIDAYRGRISKTESEMENFGHANADTDTALRVLTTGLGSPTKALHEMSLVANLAAAQHESLAAAASQDVKAHAGATRIFKQFGISVSLVKNPLKAVETAQKLATVAHDKYSKSVVKLQQLELIDHAKKKLTVSDYIRLKNAQDTVTGAAKKWYGSLVNVTKAQDGAKKNSHLLDGAFADLSHRVKGQAAAAVDSFSGKLEVWKTKIQDVAAKWGEKLGPILTTAGPLIAGLGGILSSGLVPGLGATAVAEDGVAASTNSMLLPVLAIIAGIALLVAGVIYAYTHWQTFRNVVDAVGRWFRDTLWPIIKTVAADIVIAFKALWGFLQEAWNTVGKPLFALIVGYIGIQVAIWVGIFDIAKNAFLALWTLARAIWNTVGYPIFEIIRAYIAVEIAAWSAIFQLAVAAFKAIWTGIQAVWHVIGGPVIAVVKVGIAGIRWAFDAIKGPILAVWGAIGAVLSGFYNTFIKPIVDGITQAKNDVGFFTGGRNNFTDAAVKTGHWKVVNGNLVPTGHALGGVFTTPHIARIAEAGAEAVVPLTNPSRAAQVMAQAGLTGRGAPTIINNFHTVVSASQVIARQEREARLVAV